MKFIKIAAVLVVLLITGGVALWYTGVFDKAGLLESQLETGTESAYRTYIAWLQEKQPPDANTRIQELQVEAAVKGIPAFEIEVYEMILAGKLSNLPKETHEKLHETLLGKAVVLLYFHPRWPINH